MGGMLADVFKAPGLQENAGAEDGIPINPKQSNRSNHPEANLQPKHSCCASHPSRANQAPDQGERQKEEEEEEKKHRRSRI